MKKIFQGLFSDTVFRETDPDKVYAILQNFYGGWGEIYRVQTETEANLLFQRIYLYRQYATRSQLIEGSFKLPLNNFYYKLPETQVLVANSPEMMAVPTTDPWIGMSNQNIPTVAPRYSSYWACVGANAYGITDNASSLFGFLCNDEVLYPEAFHFSKEQAARNAAKQIFLNRYFCRFGKYVPAVPVDYPVNEFYVDEKFEENLGKEEENQSWEKLLNFGMFQRYFGG